MDLIGGLEVVPFDRVPRCSCQGAHTRSAGRMDTNERLVERNGLSAERCASRVAEVKPGSLILKAPFTRFTRFTRFMRFTRSGQRGLRVEVVVHDESTDVSVERRAAEDRIWADLALAAELGKLKPVGKVRNKAELDTIRARVRERNGDVSRALVLALIEYDVNPRYCTPRRSCSATDQKIPWHRILDEAGPRPAQAAARARESASARGAASACGARSTTGTSTTRPVAKVPTHQPKAKPPPCRS